MSDVRTDAMGVSREAAAEAAVWVTRLHGPDRTPELEAEFREWLAKDAVNATAFERSTAVWDSVLGISATVAFRARKPTPRPTYRVAIGSTVFASLAVVALGWFALVRDTTYETGVGEQRSITLADGSRVLLNTHTRMISRVTSNSRLVELESGEALFEVAKKPEHPFVVLAGGKRITALGTTFDVRHDSEAVAVTLLEGKVGVTDANEDQAVPAEALKTVLAPGQRLRVRPSIAPQIDLPAVEQVVAWRRGEVLFDETPLDEAIAEMNRYSRVRLVTEGEHAAGLKVSGVFRTGDSEAFAHAVSSVHGLTVMRKPDRIVLAH